MYMPSSPKAIGLTFLLAASITFQSIPSMRSGVVFGRESLPGRRTEVSDKGSDLNAAAADNVFLNAPVPKPAPEPPALAPTIVATKDDGLAAATTVAPCRRSSAT